LIRLVSVVAHQPKQPLAVWGNVHLESGVPIRPYACLLGPCVLLWSVTPDLYRVGSQRTPSAP
jgi:hypothetical protein